VDISESGQKIVNQSVSDYKIERKMIAQPFFKTIFMIIILVVHCWTSGASFIKTL